MRGLLAFLGVASRECPKSVDVVTLGRGREALGRRVVAPLRVALAPTVPNRLALVRPEDLTLVARAPRKGRSRVARAPRKGRGRVARAPRKGRGRVARNPPAVLGVSDAPLMEAGMFGRTERLARGVQHRGESDNVQLVRVPTARGCPRDVGTTRGLLVPKRAVECAPVAIVRPPALGGVPVVGGLPALERRAGAADRVQYVRESPVARWTHLPR